MHLQDRPQRSGRARWAPEPSDLRHSRLHYDRHAYCGHPRQAVFKYCGSGEIVVGHNHAPCNYEAPADVQHDLGGYHSRAVVLLQRSMDGGATWPEADDVVIYDETIPSEAKRAFLYQGDARREDYDMFRPESLFFFGRTYLPEGRGRAPVCFPLRSPDKGRTWESVPTIVTHPAGQGAGVHKDCHPVVRMPDGETLLAAMSIGDPGGPAAYASTNHGVTWDFLSRVAVDASGRGRFTYAGLLLTAGGELQCYFLHIHATDEQVEGTVNAICMSVSPDGGKSWTDPRPIVSGGSRCWKNPRGSGRDYRSPWSMLLRDGRILVVFGRRRMPMGIGGVVSEDEGRTWSEEFVVRDDAPMWDLGYPVGCQLEDGGVFIAYYYNEGGPGQLEAVRYIAGSAFRLD